MDWKTWTMAVAAAVAVSAGCRTVGPGDLPEAREPQRAQGDARLFLMRWDPQVSSFGAERFAEGMKRLHKGDPTYMDWNARDWRDIRAGDWALWVRVGGDNDGIVGIWRLNGDVEEGTSWRGDGSVLHYAWGQILMMQEPSATGLFTAESLAKAFPEINWHGGHAGVRVEDGLAERLARHVANELAHAKSLRKSAFAADPSGKAGARCLASAMLSNACPEFLAELKGREGPMARAAAPWLPYDGDCVVFDPADVKPGVCVEDVAHWVEAGGAEEEDE